MYGIAVHTIYFTYTILLQYTLLLMYKYIIPILLIFNCKFSVYGVHMFATRPLKRWVLKL